MRGHFREGRKSQNTLSPTHTQLPKGLGNFVPVQGKLKILHFSLVSLSMSLPVAMAPRQCPQSLKPDSISRLVTSVLNAQETDGQRLAVHPSACRQGLQRIFFSQATSRLVSKVSGAGTTCSPGAWPPWNRSHSCSGHMWDLLTHCPRRRPCSTCITHCCQTGRTLTN